MVLETIAVGSALVKAFSSFSAGRKKKQRAALLAREKIKEANELERRTNLELDVLQDEASGTVGRGRAQFAGQGIDVGSGASVQAEMESFENFTRTALNKKLESEFRQNQLKLEAKLGKQVGADQAKAGNIQAVSGLVNSGINIFGGG